MNSAIVVALGALLLQPVGCTTADNPRPKTKHVYLSEPSEKYKKAMLDKCSSQAYSIAVEIYKEAGEEIALQAYQKELQSCSLKENLFI